MKILMISNNYYPYTGGVARSIDVTMKLLRQAGHEVCLVTYDFTGKTVDELDIIRISSLFRFNYRGKIIPMCFGSQRIIEQCVKTFKPDLIHVHHPFALGIFGLRIAQKYKIPVVFTHHTLYENYIHYLPCGHYIAKKILPYYMRWFYKQLQGIIAPSLIVMHQVQSQTNVPCHIIPSSIDPIYIQKNNEKKFDNSRSLFLMTASRLAPEKNIDELLHACSLLTIPYQLKIFGDGYIRSYLEDRAYNYYNLSNTVQFMGELNREQLAQAYAQADIFIFASRSETQGLVIGEAMASGTPVVAFRGSGVEDALQHGGGILVDNAKEMANAIIEWHNSRTLFKKHADEAYINAQFFYPSQCISKLIQFYELTIKHNNF